MTDTGSEMLKTRLDVPESTTAKLNSLIEAHESGRLKGALIVFVRTFEQEGTGVRGMEPVADFFADHPLVKTILSWEVGLVMEAQRMSDVLARQRQAAMAEQQARHEAEDKAARKTILAADGTPLY